MESQNKGQNKGQNRSLNAADGAAAGRRARFGRLPERIRREDMVEERQATPADPARYAYDPEGSWRSFACVAADLGL